MTLYPGLLVATSPLQRPLSCPLLQQACHACWTGGQRSSRPGAALPALGSKSTTRPRQVCRPLLCHASSPMPGTRHPSCTCGIRHTALGKVGFIRWCTNCCWPACAGFRGRILTGREDLWRGRPYRPLTLGLRKSGGRNSAGRTTVWHRGGGSKRLYRFVRPPCTTTCRSCLHPHSELHCRSFQVFLPQRTLCIPATVSHVRGQGKGGCARAWA